MKNNKQLERWSPWLLLVAVILLWQVICAGFGVSGEDRALLRDVMASTPGASQRPDARASASTQAPLGDHMLTALTAAGGLVPTAVVVLQKVSAST